MNPSVTCEMVDISHNTTNDELRNPMFTSVSSRASSAYRMVGVQTSVESASPHALIQLVFDASAEAIAAARGAMARSDLAGKGVAIAKAVTLIDQGLKCSLDRERGGELAENLAAIYDYCVLRLTQANLTNDDTKLAEVSKLMQTVSEAWQQISSGNPASADVSLGADDAMPEAALRS